MRSLLGCLLLAVLTVGCTAPKTRGPLHVRHDHEHCHGWSGDHCHEHRHGPGHHP